MAQDLSKEEYDYRVNHGFDKKYLKHEHKFFAYGEPTGFNMCLAMRAEECDPASHGGTNVHARCSICGKEARFNRNGDRYEPHRPGEKFMGWEVA